MAGTAPEFYDELARHYHLMFENWETSMARQSAALGPILERACGPAARVLDCACGIGTQALGLAGRGLRVTGSDVSAAAVARARTEAAQRGLEIPLFVADMRDLSSLPDSFDAVIAMDNALPHVESDADLRLAAQEIRSKLRPGGIFLASIRDYDRLIEERPVVQGPAFLSDSGRRRIVFQLWDWLDQRRYTFHLYITSETENGWQTHHGASIYRAVLREELSGILQSAGFVDVQWLMPSESGFYQQIVLARSTNPSFDQNAF
jgi:glycine/sarcosine N-methyltransferase